MQPLQAFTKATAACGWQQAAPPNVRLQGAQPKVAWGHRGIHCRVGAPAVTQRRSAARPWKGCRSIGAPMLRAQPSGAQQVLTELGLSQASAQTWLLPPTTCHPLPPRTRPGGTGERGRAQGRSVCACAGPHGTAPWQAWWAKIGRKNNHDLLSNGRGCTTPHVKVRKKIRGIRPASCSQPGAVSTRPPPSHSYQCLCTAAVRPSRFHNHPSHCFIALRAPLHGTTNVDLPHFFFFARFRIKILTSLHAGPFLIQDTWNPHTETTRIFRMLPRFFCEYVPVALEHRNKHVCCFMLFPRHVRPIFDTAPRRSAYLDASVACARCLALMHVLHLLLVCLAAAAPFSALSLTRCLRVMAETCHVCRWREARTEGCCLACSAFRDVQALVQGRALPDTVAGPVASLLVGVADTLKALAQQGAESHRERGDSRSRSRSCSPLTPAREKGSDKGRGRGAGKGKDRRSGRGQGGKHPGSTANLARQVAAAAAEAAVVALHRR